MFFFRGFFFFIHALFIFFVFKMFIWKIWVFISDWLWRNKLAWSISNFAELFNWIALIIIWIDFTLKGYIGKEKTTHLYKTFFFIYKKFLCQVLLLHLLISHRHWIMIQPLVNALCIFWYYGKWWIGFPQHEQGWLKLLGNK